MGLIPVVASVGIAQTPAQPAFEVVSIRPNTSGDERSSSIVMPGDLYRATNVTLRMLIKTAYQVHDDQKAPGGLPPVDADGFPSQLLAMFRRMLEDRFRLVTHWETREGPISAAT